MPEHNNRVCCSSWERLRVGGRRAPPLPADLRESFACLLGRSRFDCSKLNSIVRGGGQRRPSRWISPAAVPLLRGFDGDSFTATTDLRICGRQMRQTVAGAGPAPTATTSRRICGEQTRESVWAVNSGPVELPQPKSWQMAVAPGNRCPRHAEPAVRCAEPLASQRFCMARGGIRPCRASSLAKLSSLLRSNRGSPSSQPSGRYKTAGRRCAPSPATFEFSHELQQTR